jgi:DNA-binding NarL/FixJ family response regulator
MGQLEEPASVKISILVADDHPHSREGLRRLLDGDDVVVVATAQSGEEAVKLAAQLKPNVALIDVAMPGVGGIEAARQIKENCPQTAIIMFSAYDYEAYVSASLQAGASGYLLKDANIDKLISAIKIVHEGGGVFDRRVTENTVRSLYIEPKAMRKRTPKLNSRQIEVLRLVAKGKNNKEIGKELYISDRTVQTHLMHIFRNLDVGSRTEAVVQALKRGYLSTHDIT